MQPIKKVVLAVVIIPLLVWIVFALVIGVQLVTKKRSDVSELGRVTSSLPFGKLIGTIGVEAVNFNAKKTSGIGPGSIQQTIVIYQLSSSAIEALNNDGIGYLQKLSANHPSLIMWEHTPIEHQNNGADNPIIIRSFMDVPPTLNQSINLLAIQEGGYYVVNKGVTMIVAPHTKQLVIVVSK
jgi:hypothetical protein